MLFATNRFHEYCYGRHFDVLNGHKPLQGIFSKSLVNAPPRIHRLLLRLQRCGFDFHYVPGIKIVVFDCLGLIQMNQSLKFQKVNSISMFIHLISNFPMTDAKLEEFKTETENDSALQTVKKYISEGWPEKCSTVDPSAQSYFTYRNGISYAEGLLLKGNCVIVPSSMRKDIKNRIHQGHLGIAQCRSRVRQVVS